MSRSRPYKLIGWGISLTLLLITVFFFAAHVNPYFARRRQKMNFDELIGQVTRVNFIYIASGLVKQLPDSLLTNFKNIITEGVEPASQQVMVDDFRIDLFKKEKRIAYLLLGSSSQVPFANFYSPKLNFGFQQTYRIGMYSY